MSNPNQKTRVAAYGLVIENDKILLSGISKEVPRWEGHWTLPGGGLFFGEDPEVAMVREVEEETGIIVSATSIAGVDSLLDTSCTPEFHGIRILYYTKVLGGELANEVSGTCDKAAWFSLEETSRLPLVGLAKVGLELAFP